MAKLVTIVKKRRIDGAVFIIIWDKETNEAKEFTPFNTKYQWPVEVSLKENTIIITTPLSKGVPEKQNILYPNVLTAQEVNPVQMCRCFEGLACGPNGNGRGFEMDIYFFECPAQGEPVE